MNPIIDEPSGTHHSNINILYTPHIPHKEAPAQYKLLSTADEANIPIRREFGGQLQHLLLRHILELTTSLSLKLVDIAAHERSTASSAYCQFSSLPESQ